MIKKIIYSVFLLLGIVLFGTNANAETIDEWMPDKQLQEAVATGLELDNPEEITKENIRSLRGIYINSEVKTFKGLEFTSPSGFYRIEVEGTIDESFQPDYSALYDTADRKFSFLVFMINNADILNYEKNFGDLVRNVERLHFSVSNRINETTNPTFEYQLNADNYKSFSIPINQLYQPVKNFYFVSSYAEVENFWQEHQGQKVESAPLQSILYSSEYDEDDWQESLVRLSINGVTLNYIITFNFETTAIDFKLKNNVEYSDIEGALNISGTNFGIQHGTVPARNISRNLSYSVTTVHQLSLSFEKQIVQAKPVTIKYLDQKGTPIEQEQIIHGNIGDSFDATTEAYKLLIEGYQLNESKLPVNAHGVFSDQEQTVIYIYDKKVVVGKDVIIKYLDQKGNPIAKEQIIHGNIGDSFDATTEAYKLLIAGYQLDKTKLPTNASGYISDQEQVVTYVYDVKETPNKETESSTAPGENKPTVTTDENKQLPKTGENQKISFLIVGSILITLGSITIFIRKFSFN